MIVNREGCKALRSIAIVGLEKLVIYYVSEEARKGLVMKPDRRSSVMGEQRQGAAAVVVIVWKRVTWVTPSVVNGRRGCCRC